MLNTWPNTTMKKAPFELIMEHIPQVHQTNRATTSPPLNNCLETISRVRKEAASALRRAQEVLVTFKFTPYCVGDKVWLNARNLNTTHPTVKLAPKHHGPFTITAVISHMSYKLKLPLTWKFTMSTMCHFPHHIKKPPQMVNNTRNPLLISLMDNLNGKWKKFWEHRKGYQQLQYPVRWKGFSKVHDS